MAARKKTDSTSLDSIPAIAVSTKRGTFRRCGLRFGVEPILIDLDALSAAEIELLKNEPNLIVVDAQVPPAEIVEP